jgi:hypothetical protein
MPPACEHRAPKAPRTGSVSEKRYILTARSLLRYELGNDGVERTFAGTGSPTFCAPGQPRKPDGRPQSAWFSAPSRKDVGKSTRAWRVTVEADGSVLVANVDTNQVTRYGLGRNGKYVREKGSLIKVVDPPWSDGSTSSTASFQSSTASSPQAAKSAATRSAPSLPNAPGRQLG